MMEMTPHMIADDMAFSFNNSADRAYWTATVGGVRTAPLVYFKSRSSMVELTYHAAANRWSVHFSRTTCAFGDFMSGTYKALMAVHGALKATGHEVPMPVSELDGTLRLEFDPTTKTTFVALANVSDDWAVYSPEDSFKVAAPTL